MDCGQLDQSSPVGWVTDRQLESPLVVTAALADMDMKLKFFFFSSEIPILFDSSLGHCELIPMFHVMSEKEGTSREVR